LFGDYYLQILLENTFSCVEKYQYANCTNFKKLFYKQMCLLDIHDAIWTVHNHIRQPDPKGVPHLGLIITGASGNG